MNSFNNKDKKSVIKVTLLNAATVMLFVFLAVFFMQMGELYDVQTVSAENDDIVTQSTAVPGENENLGGNDQEGETNTDETSENATPENTDGTSAENTDAPTADTTASSEEPDATATQTAVKTARRTPRRTPRRTSTATASSVAATAKTPAVSTSVATQKPVATATAKVSASTSATASASVSPSVTPKPTLITPSPTLMGLEEPVVSGSAVIDVESDDYAAPSTTYIPPDINNNITEEEIIPQATSEEDNTDKTDSKGSISTLFDALVYVFAFCAIIAAIYGIWVIVKFIIYTVKSKRKKKSQNKGKKK